MNIPPHPVHQIRSLPADHKVQLYTQAMHVGIVLIVVVGVIFLGIEHDVRSVDVITILGTALGYAGGAASSATRTRGADRRADSRGDDASR